MSQRQFGIGYELVLIDTWWNVNMWNLVAGADYSSFNRYMVECEYEKPDGNTIFSDCFNRYMVECE